MPLDSLLTSSKDSPGLYEDVCLLSRRASREAPSYIDELCSPWLSEKTRSYIMWTWQANHGDCPGTSHTRTRRTLRLNDVWNTNVV